MHVSTSVLDELLRALPKLRPQMYFKSSLTALSHAMEDRVLAGADKPLVIACFQKERFYRQEAHRYQRIAAITDQVYVLAAPETDFINKSDSYETIAFVPTDSLCQEWHLIVIGKKYASCLICRECGEDLPANFAATGEDDRQSLRLPIDMDAARRFLGIWTLDRQISCQAAEILLNRILYYRPELAKKIARAKKQLLKITSEPEEIPDPFTQRLVTYLQSGQYKLLKAYGAITRQERKERLVNSITATIRRSLNLQELLQVAANELGQALGACRCLIYCTQATDAIATISHEFLGASVTSVIGENWPLQNNPLFQEIVQRRERVYIENAKKDPRLVGTPVEKIVKKFGIMSWLMVPILYQNQIRGIVELHYCGNCSHSWQEDEMALVEAIAAQVGVALIQAEAYANLEDLNQQLEALERTRSNLIAITGHELRTPLSTILVCLESLANEPDMSSDLRQVMLNTALSDADRLRKLVQDFLTLSKLESGRVEWHLEPLPLQECVDLALSNIRTRYALSEVPRIKANLSPKLPLVKADGEWLVELLAKLLDNACKFTAPQGEIILDAHANGEKLLKVTVADTGRGITPDRLEAVFDRFYQEEGALRRTAGGTGLGLAICRQIVNSWGGQIWAESAGKDQGSQFHFTIPIFSNGIESPPSSNSRSKNPQKKLKPKK